MVGVAVVASFFLGGVFMHIMSARPWSRAVGRDVIHPTRKVLEDLEATAQQEDWENVSKKISALKNQYEQVGVVSLDEEENRPLDARAIIDIGKKEEEDKPSLEESAPPPTNP